MKITASFSSMDEAENCARRLKHSCGGINAIRIRYHTRETIGDPPIEPVPMAFSSETAAGLNEQPNATGVPFAGLFALELGALKGGELDERRDCIMDIKVDDFCSKDVERIILNEHGRNLYSGD